MYRGCFACIENRDASGLPNLTTLQTKTLINESFLEVNKNQLTACFGDHWDIARYHVTTKFMIISNSQAPPHNKLV